MFSADDAPYFPRDGQHVPGSEVLIPDEAAEPPLPLITDILEVINPPPPHWLGPLLDDNSLIYRETRNAASFLSSRGGFGLTTLSFVGDVHADETGPIWLRPKFGWHFLNGPLQPDLPPQSYDLALEANFSRQIDSVWSLHLQVTPTIATDFDNKGSDAFRLVAGGMLGMQLSPNWKFVGGLTYLDRPDLPLLPIAGFRLSAEDVILDLLVPRPRFAYRYRVTDEHEESWAYVAGEIGGGSWAFERDSTGLHDVVGYRDFRILIGSESRSAQGPGHLIEAGYVFGRRLEFANGPGDFSPGNSWIIRVGTTY